MPSIVVPSSKSSRTTSYWNIAPTMVVSLIKRWLPKLVSKYALSLVSPSDTLPDEVIQTGASPKPSKANLARPPDPSTLNPLAARPSTNRTISGWFWISARPRFAMKVAETSSAAGRGNIGKGTRRCQRRRTQCCAYRRSGCVGNCNVFVGDKRGKGGLRYCQGKCEITTLIVEISSCAKDPDWHAINADRNLFKIRRLAIQITVDVDDKRRVGRRVRRHDNID